MNTMRHFNYIIQINVINIHNYANELICIFEYLTKAECIALNLVHILLLNVKYRLSCEQLTMFCILICKDIRMINISIMQMS